MKKFFLITIIAFASISLFAQQYEYAIVTTVESIIPGGLGRSRMLFARENVDYKNFTTSRTKGKDSKQNDVDRSDIKIDAFEETKLLNFFSLVGINFQNIASNDAVVTSKLNSMAAEGWELAFVSSAVESDAGKQDGEGIFITRYVFKRKK
ncbi:MAG: hypothetical protein ACUVQP_04120 [Bacteroidales bacterium]